MNISEKKGTVKHPIEEARLLPHHGIVGDAHARPWPFKWVSSIFSSSDLIHGPARTATAGLRQMMPGRLGGDPLLDGLPQRQPREPPEGKLLIRSTRTISQTSWT